MAKLTKAQIRRYDSYLNNLVGLNGISDKSIRTTFGAAAILLDEQLTAMYIGDGFTKKIVTRPANDMTRAGITIPSDPKDIIIKEMKRLKAFSKINEALRWQRLYRGSLIVVGAQDGGKLTKPLRDDRIKVIDWLKVVPAPRVFINDNDFVEDEKSKFFDDIEIFRVKKINGSRFHAHASRVLTFKGEPVPDLTVYHIDKNHLFWGMSELQPIYNQVKNYGGIEQSIVNLLYEASVKVLKLNNLPELLSEGNEEAFYKRIETLSASMSIIRAMMIGPNDEFDRNSVNFGSIPQMMDRFQMNLAGVSEIPVTLLFGRSPGGENATGDADFRSYYDGIVSKQEIQLRPPLQSLANIINGYTDATADDPIIKFNPVWTPTAAEQAKIDESVGKTHQGDIDRGVITAEESRSIRYPDLEKQ